jgi:hypothetical protein
MSSRYLESSDASSNLIAGLHDSLKTSSPVMFISLQDGKRYVYLVPKPQRPTRCA